MKKLPIVSAVERMAERKGVKLLMLGKSGIGKTTRLKDLDPATTLFLDIEAGDLAVADWPGDTIRPASWPESRDFFVFLAGPDKSLPPESAFSQAHYDHVIEKFGDPAQLDRCRPSSRFDHPAVPPVLRVVQDAAGAVMTAPASLACARPMACSARNDQRIDPLAARTRQERGVRGDPNERPMTTTARCSSRRSRRKTSLELPGIVDEVVTLAEIGPRRQHRAFVTHTVNPYGFPAKDRSGRLTRWSRHLGALIAKCAGASAVPASAAPPAHIESQE